MNILYKFVNMINDVLLFKNYQEQNIITGAIDNEIST